jgi:hypothetical protein
MEISLALLAKLVFINEKLCIKSLFYKKSR